MEKKAQQPQPRKPFQKPQLRVYGTISAITATHSPSQPTRMDGAATAPKKSST